MEVFGESYTGSNDPNSDIRIIRDRKGRLAISARSGRPRVPVLDVSIAGSQGAASAGEAKASKIEQPKESPEAASKKPSRESLHPEWTVADDLKLLQLRATEKNWDYIEAKLDNKGRDVAALKARFNELVSGKPLVSDHSESGHEAKSPTKKGKGTEGKDKADESGAESSRGKKKGRKKVDDGRVENDKEEKKSDSGSKKSENECMKNGSILKNGPNSDKYEPRGDEKTSEGEKKTEKQVEPEGYVGKHGRGEVRFLNGVPVLYNHSGSNAEQLSAEQVALMHKEVTRYERNKWLMVTSRLFDKTGIKMDPEVVRRAFEHSSLS